MKIKKIITGTVVGTLLLGVLPTIAVGKAVPQVSEIIHVGGGNVDVDFKVTHDDGAFSSTFNKKVLQDAGAIEVKGKLNFKGSTKTITIEKHGNVVLQN